MTKNRRSSLFGMYLKKSLMLGVYLKRSWMSSRLLPLVSGTKRRQKKKVRIVKPPNSQKAPASVTPDTRLVNREVNR